MFQSYGTTRWIPEVNIRNTCCGQLPWPKLKDTGYVMINILTSHQQTKIFMNSTSMSCIMNRNFGSIWVSNNWRSPNLVFSFLQLLCHIHFKQTLAVCYIVFLLALRDSKGETSKLREVLDNQVDLHKSSFLLYWSCPAFQGTEMIWCINRHCDKRIIILVIK